MRPFTKTTISLFLAVLLFSLWTSAQDTWELFLADADYALVEERFEEAEAAFRQAVDEMQSFEAEDPLRVRATTGLALALIALERSEEAVRPFEEGIPVHRDLADDALRTLADTIYRVANGLWESSFGPAAEPRNTPRSTALFRVALALYEELDGPESPQVSNVIDRLGATLMGYGDKAEIVALARRQLRIFEKNYGPDDPRLIVPLLKLATAVFWIDSRESERIRLRAFSLFKDHYGDDPQEMQGAYHILASHYQDTGEKRKAGYWAELRDKAYRQRLPKEDRETLQALISGAVMADEAGKSRRAREIYMRAAKAARSDGVEPSEAARALTAVASWLIRNQEYDRAEEHLQEAFTRANEIVETNPSSLRSVLLTLVYLRKLKGELDSALVFQLQVMELIDRMGVPEQAHAWAGFSDLYVLRNEHDKALEVALTSLALFEQLYGPDHAMVAYATQRVATVHIGLGNYDQAKESLLRTIDILERTQGTDSLLLDQPRAQYDALVGEGRPPTR